MADIVGDSLGLAIDGDKVKTDKILMCGVHFMAETAKIMSPEKKIITTRFFCWMFLGRVHNCRRCEEIKKR